MKLIAAVDRNWGIGKDGKLLVRISEDQKFFKRTTMGHTVILGRKTLEEFPHGKPLAGRTNLILSRNSGYAVENAVILHSMDELFGYLKRHPEEETFVIGGESVYRVLYAYCEEAVITQIDGSFSADAYLPNLDTDSNWKMISSGEWQQAGEWRFRFTTYKNFDPRHFE